MKNEKQEVWQQILNSSNDMAEVAERNDWELLQELVKQRKKLLSEFFSEPIVKDQHLALEKIRDDISEIMTHDTSTKRHCLTNKEVMHDSLHKLQRGKSAVKMYS